MKNKLRTALMEASNQYSMTMSRAVSSLYKEDVGWDNLSNGNDQTSDAIPLEVIKSHALRSRRLVSLNPLVKRGVTVRNAYMWADMPDCSQLSERAQTVMATPVLALEARVRDETAFNTDGMVVYTVNKSQGIVAPVPITRVSAVARSTEAVDEADIYAFLIEPVPVSTSFANSLDRQPEWVVVDGNLPPANIGDSEYAVDRKRTVVYACVNRQAGEQWGKPDLMGAVYWAQAYKETLEASYQVSRALARIAYKVSSMNSRQQAGVVSQMGGAAGSGGTVSLGVGQDIVAVSKSGAGLDYSASTPLASMVSAALDVPLSVLLTDGSAGGRQGAETALEDPTFKAFDMRRNMHVDLIKRIAVALGEKDPEIRIGTLNNDLVQRRLQSIVLAKENNFLWPDELRALTLEVLRPSNAHPVDDLPHDTSETNAQSDTLQDDSKDGRETGVGPLSDGTNAHRETDETVA